MQKKQWLKIIGVIELLLASVIGFIFLLSLLSPLSLTKPNNHPDGSYEIGMILVGLVPVFIVLLAMGLTAYRQHESAVVMQFLGLILLIVIPLILFI